LSDHLTNTQIEDYGRQLLPAAEWLFVVGHIGVCEACRRKVEGTVNREAAYFALKSGVFDEAESLSPATWRAHLTFEQMAGFVDGAIAGEELQVVKNHLTWCEECETSVDDLRAFKDQVAPELVREDRLSAMGAATESRWHRLAAALPFFQPRSLVFGSALAALLLAVSGWLVWQALPKRESKQTVTTASPSPSVPVSPGPAPAGTAAIVIVRLNDGEGQVALDQEGQLSGVAHMPTAYQQMIKRALTDQELERSPLLAGLTQPGITPRGGSPSGGRDWDGDARRGQFAVIEPVGAVILSDRPTFRWSRLNGATGYVVEIYDEKLDLAVTSPQVFDHSWTAPQSLKRDGIYYWQVKTIKDGREFKSPRPPAPQAKFRILDEAKADELARARRAYASSHLTMGLLYGQAGLLYDAERELRALQKANPNSAIASQLLRRVRAMRRPY
jgi:hypothetical protein